VQCIAVNIGFLHLFNDSSGKFFINIFQLMFLLFVFKEGAVNVFL
jgi:hypothetical protein